MALIGWLLAWWLKSYELTVTDKRIYGKISFGKRVDLPQDSVTAISTTRFLKGVAVSTASGSIKFLLIKNATEIYQIMNEKLIERQENKTSILTAATTESKSTTEELKKYKELLDSGVITQEEFDAKKKQLLGL